jgi:tetratricopeptide (TPR) repeat protein/DNA-binding CsgD family transcriptional regulator
MLPFRIHHLFCCGHLLIFLFLLSGFSLFARTNLQDIDSVQNLLRHAKGIDRLNQMNRLIILYAPIDSVKSFDYFKKSCLSAARYNYDKQVYISVNNLMTYDNERADYHHAILILKKAIKFGEENNLPKIIGFANSTIGLEYLRLNNFNSAFKYQGKALQQFTDIGCKYGLSVVYERLGVIFMIKNEFITALKYFYLSLNLNRKLKLKHETGISYYHIGLTKLNLADYQESVDYVLKSLKIWNELDETANRWNSNELIGNVYIKMGNYSQALKYHRIALNIRQENVLSAIKRGYKISPVYKLGLAYSYNNIAEVYLDLKHYDSAYYYALKGYRLKTEENSIASKNDVANSEVNLGNIYCALQKYDSAYLMLSKAAITYKELNNKSAYSEALFGLGVLNDKLKKYAKAKANYLDGLKTAKQVDDRYDVEKGYKHLSDLYSTIKDYKKALIYHTLYTASKDSMLNVENQNKIDELQIKFGVDKKEQEIAHQKNIIEQKKKQVFYSLLISVLLLILAIIIIAFIIITKRQKEKILEKENENLQKELELKNKDLVCNVSKIYAKNQVINHVAHSLISSSNGFKQANQKLIRGIVNELKQNMDETGWKEFDIRFARVHENFYDELDKRFPNLTKTERKLCAMLKLGMSSKEIASITMIRSESVDTGRSRLRKKLGLKNDDNLFEFLNKL